MQILTQQKMSHFESKETYLHRYAKEVLAKWWNDEYYFGIVPLRIDIERELCMNGNIIFVPDLIINDINGMRVFAEIEYKNPVNLIKCWQMIRWSQWHGFEPLIVEVSAYWIMKQVYPPQKLNCKILYAGKFDRI